MTHGTRLRSPLIRAEDRALPTRLPSAGERQPENLSAARIAKTEGGRGTPRASPALLHPFGIGSKALNLRGTTPRQTRHDVNTESLTAQPQISSSR